MDHMIVRIEAEDRLPSDRRASAAAEVIATVKEAVGITVGVDIVEPDTLERSVGKLRRVVDERERE